MITKLLYYNNSGVDPHANLAIEQYLMEHVEEDTCILYLWQNQNTVVIGKNQNAWAECRCALLESEGGTLARRLSGGGAVFHDLGNLNFTFLCSTENFDTQRQMKVIQAACHLSGIETELSGRNDILAEGKKFSGNAFYHKGGKSYHHGTLLINADTEKVQRYLTPPKAKLETKGVKSVRSRIINLAQLSPGLTCQTMKTYMISAFEQVYGLRAEAYQAIDLNQITSLAEKYSNPDFLYNSPFPFSLSCEGQFAWGHIELQVQIETGVITSVTIYTDSMDWQLPEAIKGVLIGCPFKPAPIKKALTNTNFPTIAQDVLNLLEQEL